MADLIRLLSLEGPLLGVGMLIALVWLIITVNGLVSKVTGLDSKVTGLDSKVTDLATKVAHLGGRQVERDRQVDMTGLLELNKGVLAALRARPDDEQS